jgi:hypothetical protein
MHLLLVDVWSFLLSEYACVVGYIESYLENCIGKSVMVKLSSLSVKLMLLAFGLYKYI